MTSNSYFFEIVYKNGNTTRLRVLADTKEEAITLQLKPRNDIASYKYIGMKKGISRYED